jgi:anaerobic selenocysteine-containing dehydrogenase
LVGGKVEGIRADPNHPVNRGGICVKAEASLEYLESPHRLLEPLKRDGPRGAGCWKKVSWQEALDLVAEQMERTKASHGARSVVFMRGSFKGGYEGVFLARLANLFGTPNISSMASVCYVPRVQGSALTFGFHPVADYTGGPKCVVVWGANLRETRVGEHLHTLRALDRGSILIVIDPRRIPLAEKADLWLSPRPGTDLALALGMIHTIIVEGLYDAAFVGRWTVGFEALESLAQRYPPEKVEEVTWVPASKIRQAARLYAESRPAIIQLGNAVDHTVNSFQTARAVSMLRAITGNIGVRGGEVQCETPPVLSPLGCPELDLRELLPEETRRERLGGKEGLLPLVYYALPQAIIKAILEDDPYPVKMAYVQGGNFLVTYPNSKMVRRAFESLEFLVVADMFMTLRPIWLTWSCLRRVFWNPTALSHRHTIPMPLCSRRSPRSDRPIQTSGFCGLWLKDWDWPGAFSARNRRRWTSFSVLPA